MLSVEENELLTKTGPDTPMGRLFRRFWTPVLLSKELPAPDCPPVRVTVLGDDLIAFRDSSGRVGLLDRYCRHRCADLYFGRCEDGGLRCVYHGWLYDVDGKVVDMPNEPPDYAGRVEAHTTAYPTHEQAGLVWAYMGPPNKMPPFPQIEWTLVPEGHRHVGKVFVDCNYLQAQEGNFDSTHVQFLHLGSNPQLSSRGIAVSRREQRQGGGPSVKWLVWAPKVTDYGLLMANRRPAQTEDSYAWHINHFLMPYTSLVAGGTPGNPFLVNVHVPINDEAQWTYVVQWHPDRPLTEQEVYDYDHGFGFLPELIPGTFLPKRNRDNNYLLDRGYQRTLSYSGIGHSFYEQDMAITGNQGSGRIYDRSKELLGTADLGVIALRRLLMKAARDLDNGIEPYWARNADAYKVRSIDIVLPNDMPPDEGAQEWIAGRRQWVTQKA